MSKIADLKEGPGDNGKPIVEENPEHEIFKIFINLAKKIQLSIKL